MAPTQLDFKPELNAVDFHGQVLQVLDHHGKPYVLLKRICVNLGLDWSAQRQRIMRDKVLSEGMVIITTPSSSGDQEMVCLPLEYLNGWLFGIDDKRVAPEIREALIIYKREAYGALYNYFVKGFALNNKRLEVDEDAREAALQELRKLRTSDKTLYRKVTDAIKQTSADYETAMTTMPNKVTSLFARIQDTFHFAVSGKTSAELVIENADGTKPLVGMVAYDGSPESIQRQGVRVGKNYLNRIAFRKLEILYEQLFLFAENKIIGGDQMTLAKWEDQLQKLLIANGYEPRGMYKQYKAAAANAVADKEYEKYRGRIGWSRTPAMR